MDVCPIFLAVFGHFESLASFSKIGTNLSPKQLNRMFLVSFSKIQQLYNNFPKRHGYFDQKLGHSRHISKTFQQKTYNFVKKIAAFWTVFLGHKGDHIDVWMVKIMMKTNHIDMDVYLFQK